MLKKFKDQPIVSNLNVENICVYCFSQDTLDSEKEFYLTEYLSVHTIVYTIIDLICIAISHQRQDLRCEM